MNPWIIFISIRRKKNSHYFNLILILSPKFANKYIHLATFFVISMNMRVLGTDTRHRCGNPRFISTRRPSITSNKGTNRFPGRQCPRKRPGSATEA